MPERAIESKLAGFVRSYIDVPDGGDCSERQEALRWVCAFPCRVDCARLAIWGKTARGPFWIEPFLASVRVSESSDTIVNYDLGFGDAVRGLGTVPYGKHLRRADWFFPTEWLFRFSKGAAGK